MDTENTRTWVAVLAGMLVGGFSAIALFLVTAQDRSYPVDVTNTTRQEEAVVIAALEVLHDSLIQQGRDISVLLHQMSERQQVLLQRPELQRADLATFQADREDSFAELEDVAPVATEEEKHDERVQALLLHLQDPVYREELTMSAMAHEVSDLPVKHQRMVSARINELLRSGELTLESLGQSE